ncbi:hypothetical protein FGO68_gene851 [Halteria grandinella]|uniref:Uncharacterized protein n=1 Tax=Halteria grandinella TaxID=5974 RepID=A0A8J8NZU2_HALGN|nr:hypothetical protein FGO68_gene851 [Halteria grandinella]
MQHSHSVIHNSASIIDQCTPPSNERQECENHNAYFAMGPSNPAAAGFSQTSQLDLLICQTQPLGILGLLTPQNAVLYSDYNSGTDRGRAKEKDFVKPHNGSIDSSSYDSDGTFARYEENEEEAHRVQEFPSLITQQQSESAKRAREARSEL